VSGLILVDPPHHFPAGRVIHCGARGFQEAAPWNAHWWSDLLSDESRERSRRVLLNRIRQIDLPLANFVAARNFARDIVSLIALTEVDVADVVRSLRHPGANEHRQRKALLDLERLMAAIGRAMELASLDWGGITRTAAGDGRGAVQIASRALARAIGDRKCELALPDSDANWDFISFAAGSENRLTPVVPEEMDEVIGSSEAMPFVDGAELTPFRVARIELWADPPPKIGIDLRRYLARRGVRSVFLIARGRTTFGGLVSLARGLGRQVGGIWIPAGAGSVGFRSISGLRSVQIIGLALFDSSQFASAVDACRKSKRRLWVQFEGPRLESLVDVAAESADVLSAVRVAVDSAPGAQQSRLELQVEVPAQALLGAVDSTELALCHLHRPGLEPLGDRDARERKRATKLDADDTVAVVGNVIESPMSLTQCQHLAAIPDSQQDKPETISSTKRLFVFADQRRRVIEIPSDYVIRSLLAHLAQPRRVRDVAAGEVWVRRLMSMGLLERLRSSKPPTTEKKSRKGSSNLSGEVV
jgi:hypothetical protein